MRWFMKFFRRGDEIRRLEASLGQQLRWADVQDQVFTENEDMLRAVRVVTEEELFPCLERQEQRGLPVAVRETFEARFRAALRPACMDAPAENLRSEGLL